MQQTHSVGSLWHLPCEHGEMDMLMFQERQARGFYGVLLFLFFCLNVQSQEPVTTLRIDASKAFIAPAAAPYDLHANRSVNGHVLDLNSRYLTRDGRPWLPVMGEFHFSRVPRAEWDDELAKMKSAGVQIVSTYILWIHHEEIEGQFDWSGQRDLRAFVKLCAQHGLLFEARVGPWAHAEARNGGLPDWLLQQGPTRRNDPRYLESVERFYAEIGRQLHGLMWKDGGPVIAAQIENEYAARGAGKGEDHLLRLKQMAIGAGIDVPFYFVTGWDNAVVPERAFLPVYGGGYPDAPWDGSIKKLAPGEVYAFRFRSRVAANMGAMQAKDTTAIDRSASLSLPYLTAEIGGGIEDTYHRRPVIHPDEIGAMFPVMLGSGVNLYGTYMLQGGQNPESKRTTLEESQATGYPNDLPIKSYDFQAPLGAYGQERASLARMKLYQYFLNSFGEDLAPMIVHAPEKLPEDPADFSVPRAAVRTQGERGFLFVNNAVRNYAMPERKQMQFAIQLPSGLLRVPEQPVNLPSGSYFIWPLHMPIGKADLLYSTAQPFTRLEAKTPEYVFAAVRGIAPEFVFSATSIYAIQADSGRVIRRDGRWIVRSILPGARITLTSRDGAKACILLLSAEQAEQAWKIRDEGRERLLLTPQQVIIRESGAVHLQSLGIPHFAFKILPAPKHAPQASLVLGESGKGEYAAQAKEKQLAVQIEQDRVAGVIPPIHLAPPPSWRTEGVAQAPEEGELPQAAAWRILLPAHLLDGLSDAFLRIHYQADVARLYEGTRLLDDDFYNGNPWEIGLKRYAPVSELRLHLQPLRKDAPVYFELPRPVVFDANAQAAQLEKIELIPQYELRLDFSQKKTLNSNTKLPDIKKYSIAEK